MWAAVVEAVRVHEYVVVRGAQGAGSDFQGARGGSFPRRMLPQLAFEKREAEIIAETQVHHASGKT